LGLVKEVVQETGTNMLSSQKLPGTHLFSGKLPELKGFKGFLEEMATFLCKEITVVHKLLLGVIYAGGWSDCSQVAIPAICCWDCSGSSC